jgi:hypothetical protein
MLFLHFIATQRRVTGNGMEPTGIDKERIAHRISKPEIILTLLLFDIQIKKI